MTQEQEDLKLVAEFDGWKFRVGAAPCFFNELREGYFKHRSDGLIMFCEIDKLNYHTSWSKQIPVWAKLCEMDAPRRLDLFHYSKIIHTNQPAVGFKIIVDILKRIKQ